MLAHELSENQWWTVYGHGLKIAYQIKCGLAAGVPTGVGARDSASHSPRQGHRFAFADKTELGEIIGTEQEVKRFHEDVSKLCERWKV